MALRTLDDTSLVLPFQYRPR